MVEKFKTFEFGFIAATALAKSGYSLSRMSDVPPHSVKMCLMSSQLESQSLLWGSLDFLSLASLIGHVVSCQKMYVNPEPHHISSGVHNTKYRVRPATNHGVLH